MEKDPSSIFSNPIIVSSRLCLCCVSVKHSVAFAGSRAVFFESVVAEISLVLLVEVLSVFTFAR